MSPFDSRSLVSFLIMTLAFAVVAAIISVRLQRARRRARRRMVEAPNSHFTSTVARTNETRHRWFGIMLDRLHELNREEVVRLLAKVEATSVDALRPSERQFLDRMVELAGPKSPPPLEERPTPSAPDLRHRPA